MRRLHLRNGLVGITSVLVAVVLVGCGGTTTDDEDDYVPSKRRAQTKRTIETLKPVKATEYGTIRGKITWEGGEPNFEELTAALKKDISGNNDRTYCLTGKLPSDPADFQSMIQPCETDQQRYRIGKNKGLGNVFVWIEPERGHYFAIPPEQLEKVEKEIVIRQPHCAFIPHATVLFPSYYGPEGKQISTGQKFLVENDARVGHNAKIQGGPLNGSRSISIPAKKGDGTVTQLPVELRPEKGPVSVACDVHGWMKAWVRVFDHPYAAVSSVGADLKAKKWEDLDSPTFGTYEIKNVPVGAKVKLFAWHEELGFLTGPNGKEITLQKENKEDFTAKAK